MENSRLFAPTVGPEAAGDFYALVSGERLESHGAPARTAWQIERLAALRGWPAGESLGSEASLREQLQVSRETLREAIRMVESRGAMRMRRGRSGGLVLARPTVERMAASLAAYLRATGFTQEHLRQSTRGLDQLLAWQLARGTGKLPAREPGEYPRRWLARASGRQTYVIYVSALEELAPPATRGQDVPAGLSEALAKRDATAVFEQLAPLPFVPSYDHDRKPASSTPVRATPIAVAMIARANDRGTADLGNEAGLCEDFDTSRAIVRQALRILQDLDLVRVRLGRGGGYTLKQPSPIGIVRQFFAWLAARNCCPFALNQLMWDLNAANVRLAGEKLAEMPEAERAACCDRIEGLLDNIAGPARFIALQQSLAEIAACPAIDTLARCVVSYQARSYGELPETEPDPALQAMERAIVSALRTGDLDRAEATLRRLQDLTEEMAMEVFGLRAAAE